MTLDTSLVSRQAFVHPFSMAQKNRYHGQNTVFGGGIDWTKPFTIGSSMCGQYWSFTFGYNGENSPHKFELTMGPKAPENFDIVSFGLSSDKRRCGVTYVENPETKQHCFELTTTNTDSDSYPLTFKKYCLKDAVNDAVAFVVGDSVKYDRGNNAFSRFLMEFVNVARRMMRNDADLQSKTLVYQNYLYTKDFLPDEPTFRPTDT